MSVSLQMVGVESETSPRTFYRLIMKINGSLTMNILKKIRFCKCWTKHLVFLLCMLWIYEIYEVMFCYLYCMTKGVLCSVTSISVVLIEWVQAAHLQGQDDPDHQVWNQSYKSKYVVTKNETDCGGIKNCKIFSISCLEHFMYESSPQLFCNTMYVKISGPYIIKGMCLFTFLEW